MQKLILKCMMWWNLERKGFLGYNLYRSEDNVNFAVVGSSDSLTLAFRDAGVVNGTTYWYYVTARYDEGESVPSDTVQSTPFTPTLALPGVYYATTGRSTDNPGSLLTIDVSTGAGTLIGATGIIGDIGFPGVPGLAINSKGEMFATDISEMSNLYRLDAATGAAVFIANTGIYTVDAIAFAGNDVLYAVDSHNDLYIVSDTTGAATFIGRTGDAIRGLAFDPTDGTLWGSTGSAQFARVPDGIYTIDISTGAGTLVGTTGLGSSTPDLIFDQDGNLYGSKGGGGNPNNLISIDKSTGGLNANIIWRRRS